jgi:general secretion pathway protein G
MRVMHKDKARGFTLIELMVVMAAIGLLRAREVVLRQNLAAIRDAIDKFYADRGRYPAALQELVQARYLRQMPIDPVTDRIDSWVLVGSDGGGSSGVSDVHSGAPGNSREGSAYASW